MRRVAIAISALTLFAAEKKLEAPLGLDAYLPVPEDNPLTADGVRLGRKLFFDKRLSRDGSVSCATCHDPEYAFTDRRKTGVGVDGRTGPRRVPRILNRVYGRAFFWDGRAGSLEAQVTQPIENPKEMDLPLADAAARFGVDALTMRRALASYVRTLFSGDSPYDRYLAGDATALTPQQREGLKLFRGKAGCTACHLGPNLTDEAFHNTGAGWPRDEGRYAVTKAEADRGAFKTPSLRDAARTPPYMHDGGLATLDDVIEFYNKGGEANPRLDGEMRKLELTPAEKAAIIAFLQALNGKIHEGM